MDVKIEYERIFKLCHGCLSTDRKVAGINNQNKALFFKLRDDDNINQPATDDLQLCWECSALLNRIKKFQSRIKTAQYTLRQYLQTLFQKHDIHTLSLLETKHAKHYDHEFIYSKEQKTTILSPDQNELLIEQSLLDEQKCLIVERKDFSSLGNETEELLYDIKLEDNSPSIIKEEYDRTSNCDNELYEPEFKIEKDLSLGIDIKVKKNDIKSQSIKEYAQFATITKKTDIFPNKIKNYSETTFLNEIEIEEVLIRDRKCTGFDRLPYKCRICRYGYKRHLDLLRHKTFHHNKNQFPSPCMACSTQLLTQEQLADHWRDHHTAMLRCTLCLQLCRSKGEMRKHLNRTHTNIYSCNNCRSEFTTLREFSNHYKIVHERVVCDYCKSSFPSKRRLETHIKRNHLPASCSTCRRSYRTYHNLENHLREHHPELLAADTRQELRYCVECDKLYPSVYKYRRHLQQSARHTPRKKIRVPCPDCGKVFTRTTYMNNHYRLVHMKDTNHYCELCNKYFATGYGVRKHIQYVHQKVPMPKDKICDLCGRGFSTNRILTNHRRTHTGERPFKCKYCPATFAQDTAMKTHQKTQHKNINLLQR